MQYWIQAIDEAKACNGFLPFFLAVTFAGDNKTFWLLVFPDNKWRYINELEYYMTGHVNESCPHSYLKKEPNFVTVANQRDIKHHLVQVNTFFKCLSSSNEWQMSRQTETMATVTHLHMDAED